MPWSDTQHQHSLGLRIVFLSYKSNSEPLVNVSPHMAECNINSCTRDFLH